MKRLLALTLASFLFLTPAALAQNKPATTPDKSKPTTPATKPADKTKDAAPAKPEGVSKEIEEAAKPGTNHKLLEWFEGEWSAEVATAGQDKTDKGTMSCKMVYGGRFLTMDFDGRSRGKFFRGGGMWGYNNLEKRFEQTWADSEGTAITFISGRASPDGKVFTMTGECADPSGKKTMMKAVATITSKETWKDEFYSMEAGKEVKAMEILYTKIRSEKSEKGDKTEKPADKTTEKPKTK